MRLFGVLWRASMLMIVLGRTASRKKKEKKKRQQRIMGAIAGHLPG